jgi:hypothetical protein
MEYSIECALSAYDTLSRPFKTTKHVCAVLNITPEQFTDWFENEKTFKDGVNAGLIKGESKARDLIFAFSLRPANSKNTKLLTLLAETVYNICPTTPEEDATTPLPSSITIEVEDASVDQKGINGFEDQSE